MKSPLLMLSLCLIATVTAVLSIVCGASDLATAAGTLPLLGIALDGLTVAQVREKAGELFEQIKTLRDKLHELRNKNEAIPADDMAKWKELNADYDQCRSRIDELTTFDEMDRRFQELTDHSQHRNTDRRPSPHDLADPLTQRTYGDHGAQNRDQAEQLRSNARDRSLAFQTWAMRGIEDQRISDQHFDACRRIGFNPGNQQVNFELLDTYSHRNLMRRLNAVHPMRRQSLADELVEQRAMSSFTGAEGGFITVPSTTVAAVELAMIEFGAILGVVDTMTTTTGEEMSWPIGDDTDNEGAYIDENIEADEQTVDGFEATTWRSYELTSKFVKVPFRLMRDSLVNLEVVIGRMMGERLGRKLSGECTTGAARIRGIVTRAPAGQTTAGATAITYDDLVGLEHSVDPAYRSNARYMFHDNILEHIRLLKDGNSRPLYISNLNAGMPDTINGRQFVINQKMASTVATTNVTALFGDFTYYKLRRVGSTRIKRLVERFAEKDQTAFIQYISADGNLLRPNNATACAVKRLTQA